VDAEMTGGRSPKTKGSGYEREVVALAQEVGLYARRVPLSGAMQEYPNDVQIGDYTYELKRRKKPISGKLEALLEEAVSKGGIGVITRADQGSSRVYLPLATYLKLIKEQL
jgi:hypothetical protein